MVSNGDDPNGAAFTVTVDLKAGTTTGVSAADRCRLAGLDRAAALCEVMSDDGEMTRGLMLHRFAAAHGLPTITVADLVRYRTKTERRVRMTGQARLPTRHGDFTVIAYRSAFGEREHVALVLGKICHPTAEPVLVRVHSECLTGEVFGSQRCDCRDQLEQAMSEIACQRRGAVIYLRGHEGRGIGLAAKLRTYDLQDGGLDTVDANLVQGLPADGRDYLAAAQILDDLGVSQIRLTTNNPDKGRQLNAYGVRIAGQQPAWTKPHHEALAYLGTKRERMNHDIALGAPIASAVSG